MSHKIEIHEEALKTLRKMDQMSRKQILKYLSQVLARVDDPRLLGKALVGNYSGLWRYRTGHFKILCRINDEKLVVLVLKVGHRKEIYRD